MRRDIVVLDKLISANPPPPIGVAEEHSHRDRLRNVIGEAGEMGITIDEACRKLPDRPRQWIGVEMRKLARRQDGVRCDDNRYIWTGNMTRQYARRTLRH